MLCPKLWLSPPPPKRVPAVVLCGGQVIPPGLALNDSFRRMLAPRVCQHATVSWHQQTSRTGTPLSYLCTAASETMIKIQQTWRQQQLSGSNPGTLKPRAVDYSQDSPGRHLCAPLTTNPQPKRASPCAQSTRSRGGPKDAWPIETAEIVSVQQWLC